MGIAPPLISLTDTMGFGIVIIRRQQLVERLNRGIRRRAPITESRQFELNVGQLTLDLRPCRRRSFDLNTV